MKTLKITFTLDGQDNIWKGQYISATRFEIEDIEGDFTVTSLINYLSSKKAKDIILEE